MVVLWPRLSGSSCGRQYRTVWKVAMETASAEEAQGRVPSTRRRSRFAGEKKTRLKPETGGAMRLEVKVKVV